MAESSVEYLQSIRTVKRMLVALLIVFGLLLAVNLANAARAEMARRADDARWQAQIQINSFMAKALGIKASEVPSTNGPTH